MLPFPPLPVVLSTRTPFGGSGNWVSIGPVTPSHALHVATFNARRLWLHDESIHDGCPILSRTLLSENVGVCCVQDVFLLPVTNPTVTMDFVGPEDGKQRF